MAHPALEAVPLSEHLGITLSGSGTLGEVHEDEVWRGLKEHGAVLLRGFKPSTEEFKAFTDRLCHDFSDYKAGGMRIGALNRQAVDNDKTLLTVTGHTQGFAMALHGEMYYLPVRPHILWFYCQRPPTDGGGQTTLADGARLWEAFSPELKSFFEHNRLAYHRNLMDGDWQTTFLTEDFEEARKLAESQCDSVVAHPEEHRLETRSVFEATLTGTDGEKIFINNMATVWMAEWAFESGWIKENVGSIQTAVCPMVVRTEAGERISARVMEELSETAERLTVEVSWQEGDVVMVDNARVMHGRREARDKNRSILIRMGEPRRAL